MWGPLKDLNERMDLGLAFNETKLRATCRKTDAQLLLVGADDKREIEKQRGKPFHEVWIDESASHGTQLLEHFIYRIIGPRLGDYRGTLGLIGTPGHILDGPFYDATRPGSEISRPYADRDKPEYEGWDRWSLHTWSLEDNDRVHMPECPAGCAVNHLWEEALREKRANGWTDQHPVWRREYLGQWAADDTENVYKYRAVLDDGTPWNQWNPERIHHDKVPGGFAKLPEGHDWRFVFGADMGHSDPFSLEVFAYSENCKDLLHAFEYTKRGMIVRDIALLMLGQDLDHVKPGGLLGITGWPDGAVADMAALGDMLLKELAEVYGIRFEAAEKKNKHDAIELWNGDLIEGRLKLLKGSQLEQEQLHLQWAVNEWGQLKENKGQSNHCSDAGVYARRKAQHRHTYEVPAPGPVKGSAEARNLAMREDEERVAERSRRERAFGDVLAGPDNFDDFFRESERYP